MPEIQNRRAQLTYDQIRSYNPTWPAIMIEDYLELNTVDVIINSQVGENTENIKKNTQLAESNSSLLFKIKAEVGRIGKAFNGLRQLVESGAAVTSKTSAQVIALKGSLKGLRQQVDDTRGSISKVRSKSDNAQDEAKKAQQLAVSWR